MKGRLITLEGGEGAGKSTLLEGLCEHMRARGVNPVLAREPGGTPLGEAIRALVLDPAQQALCAESELLLMFAARAQLVRAVVEPALQSGQWVLCDRFTDASYAYQGGGRGQPEARIRDLEHWAATDVKPDLTLLLDVSVATGRARVSGRGPGDRIESEADTFFERVRETYRQRAAAEPARFHVLQADRAPQAVLTEAIRALEPLLQDSGR